jgi:hypothetical protein
MGFKTIMDGKFKKPRIPFFGFGVDDSSHVIIEDGLRYATNLVKKPDMRIKDLKLCLTMVAIGYLPQLKLIWRSVFPKSNSARKPGSVSCAM